MFKIEIPMARILCASIDNIIILWDNIKTEWISSWNAYTYRQLWRNSLDLIRHTWYGFVFYTLMCLCVLKYLIRFFKQFNTV